MSLRALLLLPGLLAAQSDPGFPTYTAAAVAHAATNSAGSYAANTLISIYGVNLSIGVQAITAADIAGGNLPTYLGPLSTRVELDGQFASLYYASPTQINALLPPNLLTGPHTLQIIANGRAGPAVRITFEESAPGLFESDDHHVIATHGNGPVVSAAAPAQGGEVIVLYATGLGPTNPPAVINRIASVAAKLVALPSFEVWINGTPVPADRVQYAGLTPGFAGLYQINVRLPDAAPPDPEIRVGTPGRMSPPGRFLRFR